MKKQRMLYYKRVLVHVLTTKPRHTMFTCCLFPV